MYPNNWFQGVKGLLKRIGKEKVNQKDKKVILSIIKNLSGFVIHYLEGISRFKKKKGKMIKKPWEICRNFLDFSRKIIIKY